MEKYRFQLASDIHIEKRYPSKHGILDFIVPCAPTLILAGDIGSAYYMDQFEFFMNSCVENFDTVFFVPGNNEYYSKDGYEIVSLNELHQRLVDMCNKCGIILLNNSYVETDDLIIFGSTWWSVIPDQLNMKIKIGNNMISSDDFNYMHYLARRSLNNALAIKGNKRFLCITHYCPTKIGTMNCHHKKQDFVDLVPYYFSSSEKFLRLGCIDTWVFGHTHVFRDFYYETAGSTNRTRIISNADPRKTFFKKDYVFEI